MTIKTDITKQGDTIRFSTGQVGKVKKDFNMQEEVGKLVSGIAVVCATTP